MVAHFSPEQNDKWLPLAAVWYTDDSEGRVHAQHVLHRPSHHVVHEGSTTHGPGTPDLSHDRAKSR